MPGGPELSLVVSLYNEARRAPSALKALGDALSSPGSPRTEIIVVCDGCSDDTEPVVREVIADLPAPTWCLHAYGTNRGKGHAVRHGFALSRGETVGFVDGDGAVDPAGIPRLWELQTAGLNRAVIGSRRCAGARISRPQPLHRRILGRVFSMLAVHALDLPVRDTQCGLKLFPGSVARQMARVCNSDRFAFDLELLWFCRREGIEVCEEPVGWSDQEGSRVSVLRDGLPMLWAIAALALRPDCLPRHAVGLPITPVKDTP